MIIKLILNIITTATSIIINIITPKLPGQSLHITLNEIINGILTITQQGLNFLYFIFGDPIIAIVPIVITLIILKFTIVPIVQIFRSVFINSND